jgi:cytochrome P450 family 313
MQTATLALLAIHQDIQEKVYAEIMTVFKDESVELNVDNIQKLTYLKMCIDEALRLFPSVPHFPRVVVNEEFSVGLAKNVTVGTQIHMMVTVLHRRKDIWGEDADEFKPERFSQENCDKRDFYSYAPFSHVS